MQIIDSLEHCSTRNVFHRDVKLENILVVPTTLQITLIDFGCGSFYKDTSFTDFAGTPQYYPPEWFLNRKYNGYRQTIWSCGVLLYSLITGNFFGRKWPIIKITGQKWPRFETDCGHFRPTTVIFD